MAMDTNLRVLVVEDNGNLRKVLVNIIRKVGFKEIVEADSGASAWKVLQSEKIELVLTDWSMPGMSGLDLVMKIRSAPEPICNLPVLMITAMDTKTSIVTAGNQGVDAYIIKPVSVATVQEKIEEAVAKRSGS